MQNDTDVFIAAVRKNDVDRVRELLRQNPQLVSVRDPIGATPLHFAAENGHRELVEMLLAAGADINARDDRFHGTPAGWAIEYLRQNGALLGMEIEDVAYAIDAGHVDLVKRYVTRLPAFLTAADKDGKSLKQHAAESGNAELVALFG